MKQRRYIIRNEDIRANCLRLLEGVSIEKPVEVTIKRHVKPRSTAQNSLYWAWLTIVEQDTGNGKDDLHSLFKRQFLPRRFLDVDGESVEVEPHTPKCSTVEFTEYLDRVQQFCVSELAIVLPDPDEDWAA